MIPLEEYDDLEECDSILLTITPKTTEIIKQYLDDAFEEDYPFLFRNGHVYISNLNPLDIGPDLHPIVGEVIVPEHLVENFLALLSLGPNTLDYVKGVLSSLNIPTITEE